MRGSGRPVTLLRLVEQLAYLLALCLETGERDLFTADGARVLLVDPLRDANLVEKVRLAGQDYHHTGLQFGLRRAKLMVHRSITLRGTFVEIFHADATAVKDGILGDALAFIGVLEYVNSVHIICIRTIV